jgi:hypothetical protein
LEDLKIGTLKGRAGVLESGGGGLGTRGVPVVGGLGALGGGERFSAGHFSAFERKVGLAERSVATSARTMPGRIAHGFSESWK